MVTSKPVEGGIYLYGIYLEGARWDNRKKCIGWPKAKELYSELPIMHFMPMENRVQKEEGVYECPLYKVVSRTGTLSTTGHSTNFVQFIDLPMKKEEK